MSDFTIIQLDTIDSTNNYAMQLIDANKAHHGLTITAQTQTGGKGQRGKAWVDRPGESLLMSVILTPGLDVRQQFVFNATVAAAIANVLQKLSKNLAVHIKWPNDMIVNDKKAGGILIENVLRGSGWTHSVVGIGLNVRQETFPADLPFATSLKIASGGTEFKIDELRQLIIENVVADTRTQLFQQDNMNLYNSLLYKRGQEQKFSDTSGQWQATILKANTDGSLEVQHEDGTTACYQHGQVLWEWGG